METVSPGNVPPIPVPQDNRPDPGNQPLIQPDTRCVTYTIHQQFNGDPDRVAQIFKEMLDDATLRTAPPDPIVYMPLPDQDPIIPEPRMPDAWLATVGIAALIVILVLSTIVVYQAHRIQTLQDNAAHLLLMPVPR